MRQWITLARASLPESPEWPVYTCVDIYKRMRYLHMPNSRIRTAHTSLQTRGVSYAGGTPSDALESSVFFSALAIAMHSRAFCSSSIVYSLFSFLFFPSMKSEECDWNKKKTNWWCMRNTRREKKRENGVDKQSRKLVAFVTVYCFTSHRDFSRSRRVAIGAWSKILFHGRSRNSWESGHCCVILRVCYVVKCSIVLGCALNYKGLAEYAIMSFP